MANLMNVIIPFCILRYLFAYLLPFLFLLYIQSMAEREQRPCQPSNGSNLASITSRRHTKSNLTFVSTPSISMNDGHRWPRSWPFVEVFDVHGLSGPSGQLRAKFKHPGPIENSEQCWIGERALRYFGDLRLYPPYQRKTVSGRFPPPPWARREAGPWASIEVAFLDLPELEDTANIAERIFGYLVDDIIRYRCLRSLELDLYFRRTDDARWIHVVVLAIGFRVNPPEAPRGFPHLPFHSPFVQDAHRTELIAGGLVFNQGTARDRSYSSSYGRYEMIQLIVRMLRELAHYPPNNPIPFRSMRRHTTFTGWYLDFRTERKDFTYRLMTRTLKTLRVAVFQHGAFECEITIWENQLFPHGQILL